MFVVVLDSKRDCKAHSNDSKAALQVIEQHNPSLKDKFVKTCGFGSGLEFRDSSLLLNDDSVRTFRAGRPCVMR